MRVHQLIVRLQSLPKKIQQLPVVTFEGSFLLAVICGAVSTNEANSSRTIN
jgi:hypothetical protein